MIQKIMRRGPKIFGVGTVILVLTAVIFIFQFMHKNRVRIVGQNSRYLEESTESSARTLNELFRSSSQSLDMISYLYEKSMDSKEFDWRELNALSEKSIFDFLYYATPDGIITSGEGDKIDCSDCLYFQNGINGQSGVTFVEKSRFTQKKALVFYTSVCYRGEIAGVLLGIFDDAHLCSIMSSSLFDFSVSEFLCLRDGAVVGSGGDIQAQNVFGYIKIKHQMTPDEMNAVKDAFAHGMTFEYAFTDDSGTGNACMMALENSDLMILKIFPAAAAALMTRAANKDMLNLEIRLLVLFVLYVVLMAVYYIVQNRHLQGQAQNFGQIVDSLKLLYPRLVVCDFKRGTYNYLQGSALSRPGISRHGLYEDLIKYSEGHLCPNDAQQFRKDMSIQALEKKLSLQNRFVQHEYKLKGKDQSWEKVSLIKLNADKDETTRLLVAVEDVSALKKNDENKQKALENAFRTAEAANNAKSDFLSRMSHDIRTPMNAILGLTAVTAAHLDDKDRAIDCLDKINSAGEHLLSLINEVLDMSRIESGKMVLSNSDFDIEKLIVDVRMMMRPIAERKRQDFFMGLRDVQHIALVGDSLRIRQVFMNITSNAINYTPDGGRVTVIVTEKKSTRDGIALYEAVFEDTGIGMSKEFLERLYLPFERADDNRTSKTQGFGLGMAIVKSIVTAMDGSINVKSELGRGTRFTVDLPIKMQAQKASGAQEQTEHVNSKLETLQCVDFSGKKALLVEDNELNREIAVEIIGMTGIAIDTAENGKDGLDMFCASKEGYYSIIFMDVQMPVMNGYEAATAIRALHRNDAASIPIIAMTANAFNEDVQNAIAAGMNEHIPKPLDFHKLVDAMKRLIKTDAMAHTMG